MDPFTTILRSFIGKKMYDAGKEAVASTRNSIDKFFSDWDNALKADYASKSQKEKKNTAKQNADNVAKLFEQNGTLNTDPLASKKNTNEATDTSTKADDVSTSTEGDNTQDTQTTQTTTATTDDSADIITYTYKPGDTFGQVLLNLGLSDGSRLWGSGGDVEYYTQQLIDQNMLDSRGNVKLGIPFKLRRRK